VKPIVVLCAGGHGQDIAAIVKNSGQPFAGYLDDNIDGPDILGPCLDLELYDNYLIGHNDSRIREQMDRAEGAAIAIHASAAVHLTLQALPGVVIGAHTTIGPKTRLGRHSHINGNVFITRAQIGDFVTIGPGATICGDVTIGAGSQIGAGAVISNLANLGPRVTIGAGTVVLPRQELPPNSTWVGTPARRIK
jgi:carbonic anhydrase/acetyltransferase-like protein (isoleucine patch superfamily)